MTKEHRLDKKLFSQNADWSKVRADIEDTECPVCKRHNLSLGMSMALIQCDGCGISFEYRYDRGVIPYNTMVKEAPE